MKPLQAWSIAGALGMLALGMGCGAENGAGDPSASDDAIASQQDVGLLRHRRRPTTPTPSPTSSTGSSSSGGAPTAPSTDPPSAAPGDLSSLIAAAQNADGLAIPQPAGPGGQCPAVVVALGFWACPTLGETCSFTDSAVHDCLCNRTEGEGQTPSWVCS